MNLTKLIPLLAAGLALFVGQNFAETASSSQTTTDMNTENPSDHYTFPLSDKVTRQKSPSSTATASDSLATSTCRRTMTANLFRHWRSADRSVQSRSSPQVST